MSYICTLYVKVGRIPRGVMSTTNWYLTRDQALDIGRKNTLVMVDARLSKRG